MVYFILYCKLTLDISIAILFFHAFNNRYHGRVAAPEPGPGRPTGSTGTTGPAGPTGGTGRTGPVSPTGGTGMCTTMLEFVLPYYGERFITYLFGAYFTSEIDSQHFLCGKIFAILQC